MGLAPELMACAREQWQLFCTLTFRGSMVPRPENRRKAVLGWLRSVAGLARVPFSSLRWVLRDEAGEKFGRMHYHALIAGLPLHQVHSSFRFKLKHAWRMGWSDIRLWCVGLGALDYIAEDAENVYEGGKFSGASGLSVCESLANMGATGERLHTRRVEQQRQDRQQGTVTPDNAGRFQQGVPRNAQATKLDIAYGPKQLGLCASSTSAGSRFLAANASDQGVSVTVEADSSALVKAVTS